MAEGNADSSWRLVWSDEFSGASGSAPDRVKWGYDIGGTGWGNNEKQYYTDGTNNAYLDGNGHLVIKALKENREGMPYTSARLVSTNKGDWMDYMVNVPEAGGYTVEYRVASPGATGQIQLKSGSSVLTTTAVPNTGAGRTGRWSRRPFSLAQGSRLCGYMRAEPGLT